MSVPVKTTSIDASVVETVIAKGDISKLTPAERIDYYNATCRSLGLNPLTQPFEYLMLNGKLRLYARRDATDQLRKINNISIKIMSQEEINGLYMVHAKAYNPDGREDEDFGAVALPENLRGEARANAILKAVTKAKRRVTLSICGLGFLDELEVDDIPSAERVPQEDIAPAKQPTKIALARPAAPRAAETKDDTAEPDLADEETDAERQQRHREALGEAAPKGMKPLRAVWDKITDEDDRKALKPELDGRWKPIAEEADQLRMTK